jgi:hypothetical protein
MSRGAKSHLFDSIWSDIADKTTLYYYINEALMMIQELTSDN